MQVGFHLAWALMRPFFVLRAPLTWTLVQVERLICTLLDPGAECKRPFFGVAQLSTLQLFLLEHRAVTLCTSTAFRSTASRCGLQSLDHLNRQDHAPAPPLRFVHQNSGGAADTVSACVDSFVFFPRHHAIPHQFVRNFASRTDARQTAIQGDLCGCGRLQDSFGHHRAACAQGGLLARRGSRWRFGSRREGLIQHHGPIWTCHFFLKRME